MTTTTLRAVPAVGSRVTIVVRQGGYFYATGRVCGYDRTNGNVLVTYLLSAGPVTLAFAAIGGVCVSESRFALRY